MRWDFWRPDEPRPPKSEADQNGHDEAHQALEDAMSMWPEVRALSEELRGIRRRNHLAEMTERALRGNR